MTTQQIVEAILNGDVDEGTDQIESALNRRAEVKAQILAASLVPGDRVQLVPPISPKYLIGAKATVDARPDGDHVWLVFDEGEFTGRFSRRVNAYVSTVERIDE